MATNSTDAVSMTCGDARADGKVTETPVHYLAMDTEDLHLEQEAFSQSSFQTNDSFKLARKPSELSIRGVLETSPEAQKSGILKRMQKGFKALGEQMAPLVEPLDVLRQNLESLTDPDDGGLLQSLSFLAEPLSVFRQNISPVLELFDVLKQNFESLLDSHREIPKYKRDSTSLDSKLIVTSSRREDGKDKPTGCGLNLEEGGSDPRNEFLVDNSRKLKREHSGFFSSVDDNNKFSQNAGNFYARIGKQVKKGFKSLRDNTRPVTKPLLVFKQNIESLMDPVDGGLGRKLVFLGQPFHVFGQNMESLIESWSKSGPGKIKKPNSADSDQLAPSTEHSCSHSATATPSVWWYFLNRKRVAPDCTIASCESSAAGKNSFLQGCKMFIGNNRTDVIQGEQPTVVTPSTYKLFSA